MTKNQTRQTATGQQEVHIVDLVGEPIGGGLAINETSSRKRQIMASIEGVDSVLYIGELEGEVAGLLAVETEKGKRVGFGQVEEWPAATLWVSGTQCWVVRQTHAESAA